jgi:DNA-binding beta-propeller fold protein YncE
MGLMIAMMAALALGNAGCSGSGDGTCSAVGASGSVATGAGSGGDGGGGQGGNSVTACLPLELVADIDLPGGATRFDYQDIDAARDNLVIAHMNDDAVVVFDIEHDAVVKVVPDIPTPRGVIVADDVGRIFVSSTPGHVVILDNTTFAEIARVPVGAAPDGVGWDPTAPSRSSRAPATARASTCRSASRPATSSSIRRAASSGLRS